MMRIMRLRRAQHVMSGGRGDEAAGLLLLIALATAACGGRGAANSAAPAGTVAVRLERGPCYGRCPEYVVEILEDGTVQYDGRKNVTTVGAQRATIAASAVRSLQQQFADAGYTSADSAYVEGAKGCGRYLPDGPRTVLGARMGATLKAVQLDAGCTGAPKYLQTLAARVDSVARTSRWITGTGDNEQ